MFRKRGYRTRKAYTSKTKRYPRRRSRGVYFSQQGTHISFQRESYYQGFMSYSNWRTGGASVNFSDGWLPTPSGVPGEQVDRVKEAIFNSYQRKKLNGISVYLKNIRLNGCTVNEPGTGPGVIDKLFNTTSQFQTYYSPYGRVETGKLNTYTLDKWFKKRFIKNDRALRYLHLGKINYLKNRTWTFDNYTQTVSQPLDTYLKTTCDTMTFDPISIVNQDVQFAVKPAGADLGDASEDFGVNYSFTLVVSTRWSLAQKENIPLVETPVLSRSARDIHMLHIDDSL